MKLSFDTTVLLYKLQKHFNIKAHFNYDGDIHIRQNAVFERDEEIFSQSLCTLLENHMMKISTKMFTNEMKLAITHLIRLSVLIHDTGGLSSSINVFKHCPEFVSHIRQRPSYELDAINVPSRLKCTAETGSECAGNVFKHFPVLTSQIRTDSSN
ncbi:hypothetical protein BLOT_008050 [Blomia tropicalis]|nr:hypothetical protein BLOT_008050 [Blomia tropicalis]